MKYQRLVSDKNIKAKFVNLSSTEFALRIILTCLLDVVPLFPKQCYHKYMSRSHPRPHCKYMHMRLLLVSYCFNTCWIKCSADDILIFSLEIGFDTSFRLSPKETICMKCQILFARKNNKNSICLSSAEFAHRIVSVN